MDLLYSLRKNKRLWYERLSRTENISTIKPAHASVDDDDGSDGQDQMTKNKQ